MRKEIENRLVKLAQGIELLARNLNNSYFAEQLSHQLIRSSTSAALNYGEAQAAESRKDFIHKTSIVLKELRESQISLKLISGSIKPDQRDHLISAMDECDQLIAIFHTTVKTARNNI